MTKHDLPMHLTGQNTIGYSRSGDSGKTFNAFSPAAGASLPGDFTLATTAEMERATGLAAKAFAEFRAIPAEKRAVFLEAIAESIMTLGDTLIERCTAESGLPAARITGERGRTCGQLVLFAKLIREGWYADVRIDTADPGRQPLPKPGIRRMLIPTGPVAVFGASNFPLAFSTAGGDTASALAAGCPVIVKAHSSHPGTNELVAGAIIEAATRTGMPEGVFSSLYLSREDAVALVEHPVIKAVGFTGSRTAGMHLFRAAAARPEPIPVYAEMSAVNPVILLPAALDEQGTKIAKDLAASVTLGAGQFCTNPGLVLAIDTPGTQAFLNEFAAHMKQAPAALMLNPAICKAYAEGTGVLDTLPGVQLLARSGAENSGFSAVPSAYSVAGDAFLAEKKLSEEVFGPTTLVVLCRDAEQLTAILSGMEGQLTATLHAGQLEQALAATLIDIAAQKAGRVIYGGYPTGVEVCHSMQHGGPFPSTTDARSTSVGTAAIGRFLRPVAFQDLPDPLLPAELQNANPLNVLRLVNGQWTQDPIT